MCSFIISLFDVCLHLVLNKYIVSVKKQIPALPRMIPSFEVWVAGRTPPSRTLRSAICFSGSLKHIMYIYTILVHTYVYEEKKHFFRLLIRLRKTYLPIYLSNNHLSLFHNIFLDNLHMIFIPSNLFF